MARLENASADQIEAIYRESHAVWGAGLDLEDYRGLWDELRATPWGRQYSNFLVWSDEDGSVLSSMKLYRPRFRVGATTARATVIGAVFTPSARRRRGHASAMVRVALEAARRRGDPIALLFTDIGTAYYGAFGFRALPAEEHRGTLPRQVRAWPSGWTLREMHEGDQPEVARAHDEACRLRPISLLRDEEHWRFLWVRGRGFFRRLSDPDIVQRSRIALYRGSFVGYLITVEGRGEWNVREVGAASADPERMATIVRLGAWVASRSGLRAFYGWLPPEVAAGLRDLGVRDHDRTRALPMVLPLDGALDLAPLFSSPGASYIPFQDQF